MCAAPFVSQQRQLHADLRALPLRRWRTVMRDRRLDQDLSQHMSGVLRDDRGIEWSFGSKRQIGLGCDLP
jgi:hypothetical protein